jgi:membrane protease YdiL (CAAX protease family)
MNIWKALLWTTILILTMNFLGFIISSIGYYLHIPYIISFFSQSILIVIVYYFFLTKFFNYKIDFLKNTVSFNERILLPLILLAIGLKIFQEPFFEFYKRISIPNDFPIHTINVNSELNFEFLIKAIPALIIAPLFEELIFRKIFIDKLSKIYTVKFSIIFSSLCFSLYHLPNFSNLIPTLILGLISGYLYLKSKNITISIIFHFLCNLIVGLLKLYGKTLLDNIDNFNLNTYYWIFILSGFILLIIGLKLFNTFLTTPETSFETEA